MRMTGGIRRETGGFMPVSSLLWDCCRMRAPSHIPRRRLGRRGCGMPMAPLARLEHAVGAIDRPGKAAYLTMRDVRLNLKQPLMPGVCAICQRSVPECETLPRRRPSGPGRRRMPSAQLTTNIPLVRKFRTHSQQTSRSQSCDRADPAPVIKVRFQAGHVTTCELRRYPVRRRFRLAGHVPWSRSSSLFFSFLRWVWPPL
jgi:hypothetical protein